MARLTVPVQLRWADVDPNGHVNNVAYLMILEEVRIRALHPIIGTLADERGVLVREGGAPVVVARHEIEYLRQLAWSPEPIEVDLWIARIGGSSCEIHHELRSAAGEPCARVVTTLVYLDRATQVPRRLTEAERAAYAPLLDEPLTMRGAPARL
ncbi:acyl-CoA thioesterase [Demequina sp. SYSU T00192]|uniref:Acyl-CoA thioesterase n=1 Tax=Demequina litoralis TaxID=3051660 RepID=A0ABT8G695_9MICO|nr:acyl-CoA thioesterase [Demequina sp. SYSU T00192]MDN4474670.1 acyl-CoA thioesterase [Demequina sp. SYSU T00192]